MKIFTKVILIVALASSLFGQQTPAKEHPNSRRRRIPVRTGSRPQPTTFSSWPLCCMKLMTASEPTSAIT